MTKLKKIGGGFITLTNGDSSDNPQRTSTFEARSAGQTTDEQDPVLQFSSADFNEGDKLVVFEYLFMNKPVLRTVYTVPLEEMYGKLGLACLRQHYKASAYSMEEVENFIKNVIDDVDPLKEQRAKFVKEVIMPKGQPSQNIVNDILDSIDNQIVYRS